MSSNKDKPKDKPKDNQNCGPNEDIIEMLKELANYEKNINQNTYKSIAYQKAIKSVTNYDKRISTAKEAKQLSGIGNGIALKIEEYVKKGTNPQLERVRHSDKSSGISELIRVSGIGPKTAAKLCSEGIDSIEKLKTIVDTLTEHQKIGLKYVEELEQKICRKDIQSIEKLITNKIKALNENLLITICGSYRRGAEESGDIDVLICHTKISSEEMKTKNNNYLQKVVKCLQNCGLITDTLSLGDTKYMGVCQLVSNGLHRRIDIRFLPYDQYFCGVLYFTGNDFFNQQMRRHANEMGFTLNEYSLRYLGSTGVPGEAIPMSSEKEIFEFIDFPYKEPKDRNF